MASSNAIREEYLSSLADLDQNSKPMIDMLTMLAEDHRQHAPIIVDAIKQRIAQVRQKLPLLYLIDSIVKNVGEEYKQLFQQEIVAMFVDVFDKSKNDKVREKMFALRETWKDVFLPTKLYMIDVKVNQLDPNWPIVAKAQKKPTIHVNPNFLKKIEPIDPIEQLKQEVLEKQRKLLELQKCKLDLEMRETTKKIEEEERRRAMQAAGATSASGGGGLLSSSSSSSKGKVVAPVSSALISAVDNGGASLGKSSRKDKKTSSPDKKSSSTSPKSSSKSKSGSSHRSSSSSSTHHSSGGKDRKRSSKRSSDETEKPSSASSPTKRSRSGDESAAEAVERKAKHAAVMMKRIPKISAVVVAASGDTDDRIVTGRPSPHKEAAASTNQKLILDAAAMDVDLRQFVALPNTSTAGGGDGGGVGDMDERENHLQIKKSVAAPSNKKHSNGDSDLDEENEDDSDDCGAPFAKKSKSEKMDILFGSNDVDLRSLGGGAAKTGAGLNEKEATVGWSKIKGDTPKRGPAPKTNFEAIKSRILEASKAKQKRFDERIIERKSQPIQDVDLRSGAGKAPTTTSPAAMEVEDTVSQDALDSSINIIMAQAQEQLDNQAITPDQYRNMVQQVIQLNESNKIKEAERMEKRTNGETHHSTSDSDSEEDMRDYRRKRGERKSRFQDRFPAETNAPFGGNNNGPMGDPRRGDPRRKPWEHNNNHQMHQGGPMQRGPPGANWRGGMPPPGFNNRNPWMNGPGGGRFMGPPRFNNRMPPFGPPGNAPGGPPRMPPMLQAQPPPPLLQMGNLLSQQPQLPVTENQSTMKIDNINREIRYYNDVAIVFMDWDQPKEIGFQTGTRRISCDDQWSMNLTFNAPNVTWMIDGRPHQVRLGAPTRELYIDNEWYECYVGDPCRIELDGKIRTLMIDGPPPQVRIGESRPDLVAGKISIIIDAKVMVPVYLDAREQQFEVDGHMQTVQFADYFMTVLINKEPIAVEFGGLPKSFYVHGQKHFMRFTPLPAGVVPGQFYVHGMLRTPEKRHIPSPPPPHLQQQQQSGVLHSNLMLSHPPPALMIPPPLTMPPPNKLSNGLDMLTSILPGLASPQMPLVLGQDQQQQLPPSQTIGYNLENNGQVANSNNGGATNPLGNVNVNDLFQKLLATGILGKQPVVPAPVTAAAPIVEERREEVNNSSQRAGGAGGGYNNNNHHHNQRGRKGQRGVAAKGELTPASATAPATIKAAASGSSAPILTKDKIIPVDLSQTVTIKARQLAVVQQVYLGMQCSSCGVRFPPEQTMKYSQHLDWHFRQNRRDRDSVRKAHSRKWYYDVDNWIQYEEIEDLEEREKNWFETQQSEDMGPDEGHVHGDMAMPSCPAGPAEGEKICEMCHEPFDQFYNEETEEWHLRPAVRVEEHVYHPICYEDYKLSLTLDESQLANQDSQEEEEAGVKTEVKREGEEEDGKEKNMDQSTDNDDDVIVMPMDQPSITEILDDDEEEAAAAAAAAASAPVKSPNPTPAGGGDDSNEASQDVVVDTSNIKMPMPGVVHIKSEPKDTGYRDEEEEEEDAFMDVGEIEPIDETVEEVADEEGVANGDDEKEDEEVRRTPEVTEPVVQLEEESVLTVDTSEGATRESPETIALDSPLTPVVAQLPEQGQHDDSVEMLESLDVLMPVVTIVPNKIKINISKLASASLQAEGNTDSRDSVASGGAGDGDALSQGANKSRPATPEAEILYELKESMRDASFMRMAPVANGIETSGLCCIM